MKNRGRAIRSKPACRQVWPTLVPTRFGPACGKAAAKAGFTLLSLAEVQSSLRFQMTLIQDLKFKIN